MYILDVIETCNNAAFSTILPVVKSIIILIQVIVPIILIIMCVVEFTRLSINPEDKKGFRNILNKFIAAFIIFLLPFLINAIMGVVGESTEFSNCWNKTGDINIFNNNNYINDDEQDSEQSDAEDNEAKDGDQGQSDVKYDSTEENDDSEDKIPRCGEYKNQYYDENGQVISYEEYLRNCLNEEVNPITHPELYR